MAETGPACTTCRQKCRRCDRAKPECQRCISKGLTCGGYPMTFKVYEADRSSRKRKRRPLSPHSYESPNISQPLTPEQDSIEYSGADDVPHWANEVARAKTVDIIQQIAENARSATSAKATTESPFDLSDYHSSPIASMNSSIYSPIYANENRAFATIELEDLLADERTQGLIDHYDKNLCPQLCIVDDAVSSRNPFRDFILPLAYENRGLLHALLGLTSCHMLAGRPSSRHKTEAIEHRLEAIRWLSTMLSYQESGGTSDDVPIATILMLVLHDICDSGTSVNGAHLSGATGIISRMLAKWKVIGQRQRTLFLVGTLSWLDLVRGFAGAEFLRFPLEIHQPVTHTRNIDFESVVGCPRELFLIMSTAMSKAKQFKLNQISHGSMESTLIECEKQLREWDSHRDIYPSRDPGWPFVAEAFRHACLLRVIRYGDTWATADNLKIQSSVSAILDAVSQIPAKSPLMKPLLLPLFMAGADSLSLHQRHYLLLRINDIGNKTTFKNPTAMNLLQKVWTARAAQDSGDNTNVPWMEFTCDELLDRQHDHLIF